jgi:hypothetical protein
MLPVLRFYCIQQESNRKQQIKTMWAIFEKFKFGLDIQIDLWYVVVLEKELILCQQGNYLQTATHSRERTTAGVVLFGIWMKAVSVKEKAFQVRQRLRSTRR